MEGIRLSSEISHSRTVLTQQLSWQSIELVNQSRGFGSHRGQANFSACPVGDLEQYNHISIYLSLCFITLLISYRIRFQHFSFKWITAITITFCLELCYPAISSPFGTARFSRYLLYVCCDNFFQKKTKEIMPQHKVCSFFSCKGGGIQSCQCMQTLLY